ncbi:MAG: nitrous oxide reductase accessory protein NosL [bacterium]|jgi:hypothetical protein
MTDNKKSAADSGAEDMHAPHPIPREVESGTAGQGFVGVLFALMALGVIAWLFTKLMAPYPGYSNPSEAAAKAAGNDKTAEAMANPPPAGTAKTSDMKAPAADDGSYSARLASFPGGGDPICGMAPEKSSSMVAAHFDSGWVGFVSLACFFQYAEKNKPHAVEVLDYSTFRKEPADRKLVPAEDAVYLIGIDGVPPGSMPPGVAAFSTKDAAESAMGDLGGKIADFEEMKKYVRDWLLEQGML